ncbi:MAG: hypothetical protein IIA41_03500 [SAR324 cluster bacterium]|nr:hypothetical protein [SAR324 cluster bacterium]
MKAIETFSRLDGRAPAQPRPLRITTDFTAHAEGSVLICCGETRIICNASLEDHVPPFLRGKGRGWITARSTGISKRISSETPGWIVSSFKTMILVGSGSAGSSLSGSLSKSSRMNSRSVLSGSNGRAGSGTRSVG